MLVIGDPKGWWLLAFLLLFFIILTRRMRRKTVSLTTFFLLRRFIESSALPYRRLRFRRRLSYLLFIFGAGLIALAGFRPSFISGEPPLTELAIVDLSPSLGCRDDAEPRATSLARLLDGYRDRLRPEDTLYLIAAGPRAVCLGPLPGGGGSSRRIPELDHADSPADVAGAVDQAGILLRGRSFSHVLLFTDRPERWRDLLERPGLTPPPRVITLGQPRPNAGIIAFDMRRDFFLPNSFDLFTAVAGIQSGVAGRPLLEIRGNGKLLRTVFLAPSAEGSAEAAVTAVTLEPGVLELRLLPVDAYPADNTVLAGIGGGGVVTVKVVAAADGYLAKALAANPALKVTFLDPGAELPPDDGTVFLFDGPVPPGTLPERALFTQPTQPLEGLSYRTTLNAINRVSWDRTDPILRGVDLEELSLPDLYGFEESPSFREAATADGYPLILLGKDPRRHWAILTFDPVNSKLVYTSSYPILVANLLQWLSALTSEPQGFFAAGASIGLPAAAAGGTVTGPMGKRGIPAAGAQGQGAGFTGSQAGRYRIAAADGSSLGDCFVNVLAPAVTAEIGSPGYGDGLAALPPDLPRGPARIDFAPWLILLALLVLAGHAWLSRGQASGLE